MDSVTLTIDGRALTVEKGTTVLHAAIRNGIHIPHFCYHPALTVDGSCRVCIVRIGKVPKLQTACSTVCTDGMVVDTRSPEVVEARAHVFEFLLANHPLDCPVCDKGGECPLQDYAFTFGPKASRTDFRRRVFDGEGVAGDVDFGPTLLLNRNRCILCSRCVRFMREVDGDAQIAIEDRGCGSQVATFQDEGVHSLLSGNLADVCPVGAITTRDYRFASRPWANRTAVDTICTRCSRGCNITVWVSARPAWDDGSRIVRITPRLNPAVNGFWMCDIGRFDWHFRDGADRLEHPLVRDAAGALQATGWQDLLRGLRVAVESCSGGRQGLRFLASAHAALEELMVLGRLAGGLPGGDAGQRISVSWRVSDRGQPAGTAFPVPRVDAPDVQGAVDLGLCAGDGTRGGPDLSALRTAVEAGEIPALYVLDPGPEGSMGDLSWVAAARASGRVGLLVVQGAVSSELVRAADFVLPGACALEKDAHYTNDQGLVQATATAVAPPGEAREDWLVLTAVATALGVPLPFATATDVGAAIAAELADKPAYAALARETRIGPAAPRDWLEASNPSERWKWEMLFRTASPPEPPPAGPGSRPTGSPAWTR